MAAVEKSELADASLKIIKWHLPHPVNKNLLNG